MRPEDLFVIDVAAEVATLCRAQLQGPWQVPAEIVRLAVARGASRVEIDRVGRSFRIRCDGVLAARDELADLVEIVNGDTSGRSRQQAVSRMESAGLNALLWVVGFPGSTASIEVRSGAGESTLTAQNGGVRQAADPAKPGPPTTTVVWRCRGLNRRRALDWLATALRFVPIPVTVGGRAVDRGFRDGLYRMPIDEPVSGELAVTSAGDAPALWLLEHGVLSTRAVVPGYPAFSAALEMGGRVPSGASADELRSAANPYLGSVIDRAVHMLLLLVDRLDSVDEPVRVRIVSLLLRWAAVGVRRSQILETPMIGIARGSGIDMVAPRDLAGWAARRGGSLPSVEPDAGRRLEPREGVVVATDEELSLLSELLGINLERVSTGRKLSPGHWFARCRRGLRGSIRRMIGPKRLERGALTDGERHFVEAASAAGVEVGLCAGDGETRREGRGIVAGRRRPEVRAAVAAVEGDGAWLYPALLSVGAEDLDLPEELRAIWLKAVASPQKSSPS